MARIVNRCQSPNFQINRISRAKTKEEAEAEAHKQVGQPFLSRVDSPDTWGLP
jgi:hypothetical protein